MNTERILVVDDEPQIRRVMKSALTKQGYIVADARSGEEALDKLREERYDLIILDLICLAWGDLRLAGRSEQTRISASLCSRFEKRNQTRSKLSTRGPMTTSRNRSACRKCWPVFERTYAAFPSLHIRVQ